MPYKKEKIEELIRHLAAQFLAKESGPQSLITVTKVEFDNKKNKALIFVSVLPKEQGKAAMNFVLRRKKEFVDELKENSRMRIIPFVSFALEERY